MHYLINLPLDIYYQFLYNNPIELAQTQEVNYFHMSDTNSTNSQPMFSDLLTDLDSITNLSASDNSPNQRNWTFNFSSIGLKRDFLAVAAEKGITASSLVNRLIHAFLKAEGKNHPQPALARAGRGRPLGSRNKSQSITPTLHSVSAPADPTPIPAPAKPGRPRKEKALPTPLDIQKLVLGTGSGVFPVGNIRFLTQSEKDDLATTAIQAGTSPTIAEAVYVDDLNNYFTEEFWWWNGLFFAGNAGGSKAILTEKAIQSGTYYPADPEDYRLSKYYRDALFGKHGYLLEGNGYDRNMNFKQWMDYVIAENLDWQSPETEQDNATQG